MPSSQTIVPQTVIAIDPGKDKCGVAVVRADVVRADVVRANVAHVDAMDGDIVRNDAKRAVEMEDGEIEDETDNRVLDIPIIERRIVPRLSVLDFVEELLKRFPDAICVLGNATTSHTLQTELAARFPDLTVHLQDESGSTLEARVLYWEANPFRGWRKVWPRSLQTPPEPIDDFAAVVLAQRFLQLEKS